MPGHSTERVNRADAIRIPGDVVGVKSTLENPLLLLLLLQSSWGEVYSPSSAGFGAYPIHLLLRAVIAT